LPQPIPSPFTQDRRLFRLEAPWGNWGDRVLLDRLHGFEGLSMPFRFTLDLLAERDGLALDEPLGRPVQVLLESEAGERRFAGHVVGFNRTGGDGGFAFYQAVLAPWTEFLAHRANCRIFLGETLPGLLHKLFAEYGALARWESRLAEADYPPMPQCTQYRETDWAFVSRLLEAHGVHYHFRFDRQGHTLVLADDSRAAEPLPVRDRIPFRTEPGEPGRDAIDRWQPGQVLTASAWAVQSSDFKDPRNTEVPRRASGARPGAVPELERYEHQGAFAYRDPEDGGRLAQLRLEEEEARAQVCTGAGTCRHLACGHAFQLALAAEDSAERDHRYLVTGVSHDGANNYREPLGQPQYRNRFTCIPLRVPFRPPRSTPRPVMRGPQTATVVGPPDEEIFCDRYGRVRIQFPWDREGRFTEASSCWVRVATPWAGDRFGLAAVPRVGHQVLVDFLEGDPDRPIIVGHAWDELHLPPWELPEHRTRTGLCTRSSPGGDREHGSVLCFEDRKGAEEVWLHAERDQRLEVEHDESHRVEHDRSKRVGRDETLEVGRDRAGRVVRDETLRVGRDRTLAVGNDERLAVAGSQELTVGRTQSIQVGAGKTETVGLGSLENVGGAKALNVGGAYQVTVGGGKNETVGLGSFEEVGGEKASEVRGAYRIQAGEQLEITVGRSRLTLAADGVITLAGTELVLAGTKRVRIEGQRVDLN
jgi:type VI secretion system secreted protein VgrG